MSKTTDRCASAPDYSLNDFRHSIQILHNKAQYGCGNHGCNINPPKGQGTNATCTCYPNQIARQLRRLADTIDFRAGESWQPTADAPSKERET